MVMLRLPLEPFVELELDKLIASKPNAQRQLVLAMIVARMIEPSSKLATARGFGRADRFEFLGTGTGD